MVSASQTVFSRTVVNIQEDKKKDGRCIDFCHFEDLNYGSNHRFNYRSKKKIWFCLKKSVTNLTDVAQRPAVLTWFLLSQISQNNTTASAVINHNKPLCVPSWKLNKCCAPGKIVYYYLWMGLLLFGVSNNPQKKKKWLEDEVIYLIYVFFFSSFKTTVILLKSIHLFPHVVVWHITTSCFVTQSAHLVILTSVTSAIIAILSASKARAEWSWSKGTRVVKGRDLCQYYVNSEASE